MFRWLIDRRRSKTLATIVETWRDRTPAYPEVAFESMVRHGWRKNELIFACINRTASTASQVELKIYSRRDHTELPDHPLKRLIQNPNPFMSEFDLWSSVIIYQKLAGRACFEKERSRSGRVVRLWALRPDWVKPIISSETMIGGYVYSPPGVDPQTMRPEDVLDFRLFDPLNAYNAWPPVAVAARVGDVDNVVTDYIKLFVQNGGQPPGLLKTVQRLTDSQVADIRCRWRERYGGYEHWMEPAVLDADASYQRTGLTFDEMGFDVLDARNEARICAVMDIPPILVGAKIGLDRATYANYSEARRAWWEDSLMPLYANLLDVITNQLVSEFGDDVVAEWDFSRVNALQEERNQRWERAIEAFKVGAITLNEFCAEVGLEDKGTFGQVYLRSMSTVDMPLRSDAKTVAHSHDHKSRLSSENEITAAMEGYLDDQFRRIVAELESLNHGG